MFVLNQLEKVYLVSTLQHRPDWLPQDVEYIHEESIPGITEVLHMLSGESYRGWILQQVLKYSGALYSRRFIVIDCDTVLLRPHLFFHDQGTVLRLSYEHSPQYRAIEDSLGIHAGNWFSFVCHMMPFERDILLELFGLIEKTSGMDWQAYFASYAKKRGMVISEWYLYARFLLQQRYPYVFRPWINQSIEIDNETTVESLIDRFGQYRNSVSIHCSERPLVLKGEG